MEEHVDNVDIEKQEEQKEPVKKEKVPKKEKKKSKEQLEIENLKNENALLNDKMLRLSAEMQNMKRRNGEELSRLVKYDGESFIKKILPVVDNFERAIQMDDDNLEDEVSKFLSGFKMIYSNIRKVLEEFEIKEIECLNQEFDPAFMEAVLTEHVDGKEKNTVLDVLQKGYTYKDKVIRPAMVKVSD